MVKEHRISNNYTDSHYVESLAQPDLFKNRTSFIPNRYAGNSFCISRHTTQTITTNSTGRAFIMFQPTYLNPTGVNESTLLTNTANAYVGTAPADFTTLLYVANDLAITANTVNAYRLVSACAYLYPNASMTTRSGKIGGAVMPMSAIVPNASGGTATFAVGMSPGVQAVSNIENFDYYTETTVNSEAPCLRLNYYPIDEEDFTYSYIGTSKDINSSPNECTFIYYIAGAAAASTFNLEIYYNFECTPYVISTNLGTAKPLFDTMDPWKMKYYLLQDATNISRATKNIGLGQTYEKQGYILNQGNLVSSNSNINSIKRNGLLDMISFG
jgi:hypothetical protein